MNTTDIAQTLIGFLGSLAGSGPWGLAAMGVGILALVGGIQFAVRNFNKKIDARDQENAGADAGRTATELQNQTRNVAKQLEDLGKNNPAVDPSELIKKK